MYNNNTLKKMLIKRKKMSTGISKDSYLSTGSTLLNLACSGKARGGFIKGNYYFFVGDSSSGKTFLSLTCLAEAAKNKSFEKYRFIYDNAEGGALMDIKRFFGNKVAEKMELPSINSEGEPEASSTIEEFYYNVDDTIKEGTPFIYILDSMDSLSSKDEAAKFEEHKDAHAKGKVAPGSYGDGKAKKNSANLRRLLAPLRKSGSILIIINQTRDNLGFGFETKTRSGGRALKFYACLEMWSSVKGKITKTIKNKKRQMGIKALVQVKKNRITGREREVVIPIYHSFGIDDIGSLVDYMLDEGDWLQKGPSIKVPEITFGEEMKGTRETIIKKIEENGWEKDLIASVEDVWSSVEEALKINRKQRYE